MDDTRDIALDARASASSAHKRLDSINGQIARGAEATEDLREKTTQGFSKLTEDFATGMIELVEIKTTVKYWARVLACAWVVVAGVAVYELTHPRVIQPSPPAATQIVPK